MGGQSSYLARWQSSSVRFATILHLEWEYYAFLHVEVVGVRPGRLWMSDHAATAASAGSFAFILYFSNEIETPPAGEKTTVKRGQ
jgi:hypothetical protein